ncbi:MAG: aromatic ring-hydroxylating dioxygenase subunit alpha [Sphingomonadaceae bacterium]
MDDRPGLAHLIERRDRIPAARYYDEDFFALEKERLWPRIWQMAARLDSIPDLGDWIEYRIFDTSVLIVNTKNGVKAFENACRHRGVRLGKGQGNCAKQGFICPFHGWRWNAEGQNTFVYGKHMFAEDQLDADALALPEVRSETWGGCVFINFDDDAPSYRETIGPLTDRFDAHNVSDLKAEWWFATELPANWKVAMEAFQEGYHTMKTHPQLQRAAPVIYNSMYGNETDGIGASIDPNLSPRDNIRAQVKHLELLSEGMAGMVHAKEVAIAKELVDIDLPEDPEQAMMTWYGAFQQEITTRLRAAGEDIPDLNTVKVSHYVHAIEFLFPNFFLLPMFSSMASYRIRPLTPETCRFEIWSLTHVPEGSDHVAPREPTVLPWDSTDYPAIPQQDYANIPEQQAGLHADGFDFMRLGQDVEGLLANYQKVIDGYLTGVGQDKLTAATNQLGGNFDGKVLDFGF